jgi:SAM-dependent methyltransferase
MNPAMSRSDVNTDAYRVGSGEKAPQLRSDCPICKADSGWDEARLGDYAIHVCTQCSFRFAPDAFTVPVDYGDVYGTTEYISAQVTPIRTAANFRAFAGLATYRAFFDQVHGDRRKSLLDVGCGVGRFCQAAHYAGWDVTGIDISPQAVEIGSQYASFPILNRSADDMLREGRKFDVVTAFEVLEHLADPVAFLTKLRTLAAEKGQVFCTVPNWDCVEVQTATRADYVPPIHVGFFSTASLEKLAERAGFGSFKTGIVWTDPLPHRPVGAARWWLRRLRSRPNSPLGLWFHGTN